MLKLVMMHVLLKLAGAVFVAPMVNPYELSMTKEEMSKTWERWEHGRKFMFSLGRRFPCLLSYFYRRSFFSGKHGSIEKWFFLKLGKTVSMFPTCIPANFLRAGRGVGNNGKRGDSCEPGLI